MWQQCNEQEEFCGQTHFCAGQQNLERVEPGLGRRERLRFADVSIRTPGKNENWTAPRAAQRQIKRYRKAHPALK
jgi:hypothetical protein